VTTIDIRAGKNEDQVSVNAGSYDGNAAQQAPPREPRNMIEGIRVRNEWEISSKQP